MRTYTLEEIKRDSPAVESSGEQIAFVSVGCVWWTTYREDMGSKQIEIDPVPFPCCPHCGALIMETPLKEFLEAAEKSSTHYGPYGLRAFVAAHHRGGLRGNNWDDITIQIMAGVPLGRRYG